MLFDEEITIIVQTSYSLVEAVNGKVGFVTIDKTDVGLSNVENISIIATSGYLQNQINNFTGINLTGDYYPNSNPSGFITGVDLSAYYLRSNPSGFITGLDLSSYATVANLQTTGSILDTRIQNLSGYINSTSSNIVFTTGDQTISNNKNFINKPLYQNNQVYVDSGIFLSISEKQIKYIPQFDKINSLNCEIQLIYISSSGLLRLPTGIHNVELQNLNIFIVGPGMAGGTFYIQDSLYELINGKQSPTGWVNIYECKDIIPNRVINIQKKQGSYSWNLVKNNFLIDLDNKINSLSGNLTGNYATITNLASTGSTLNSSINSLSGVLTGNYATITNLASTGSTLQTNINNLSGYINSSSSNIVFTTGDQTISGIKTFDKIEIRNINYNYFINNITLSNNYINLANSISGITVTLPSITSGRNYIIKNLNTGIVTLTGSNVIDGFVSLKLYKNESTHLLGVNNIGYTGWITLNTNAGAS